VALRARGDGRLYFVLARRIPGGVVGALAGERVTGRKLSPAEIEDQLRGARRIAPGLWIDRHGALHICLTELLELVGLEDTPENREQAYRTVRRLLEEQGREVIKQEPE
jgi:hypothetical protein